MGRQLVAQGGSGFQMGTGSALDALRESAINARSISPRCGSKRDEGRRRSASKAISLERKASSAMIGGFISGAAAVDGRGRAKRSAGAPDA
jgi:hypothetical protein